MKKLIVWGTGNSGKLLYEFCSKNPEYGYQIIGFTNSYGEIPETPGGIPFVYKTNLSIEPGTIDAIVIACDDKIAVREIRDYLISERSLSADHIIYWRSLVRGVRKEKILKLYEHSSDPEIFDTLQWLQTNELTVYNQFELQEKVLYEVYFDSENGFPYIKYKDCRVYYPIQYSFQMFDGKPYIVNFSETVQKPESPHCYEFGSHRVSRGDIIVDAGVAEGNFTIEHIDIVKKAYLFECDPQWLDALHLTLKPFKDKVVLIPKQLGACDSAYSVRLDSVIKEAVDFIKMDIEGAECESLLGGMDLLRKSNAKLSICAYHRQYDENYISFILQSLGYETSHSRGRMLFLHDPSIDRTLDFRHGVIYGERN